MIETIPGDVLPTGSVTKPPARAGAHPPFADWLAQPGRPPLPDAAQGNGNEDPPRDATALLQPDAGLLVGLAPAPHPTAVPAAPIEAAPMPGPLASGAGNARARCFELVASPWKLVATGLARIQVLGADTAVGLPGRRASSDRAASVAHAGTAVSAGANPYVAPTMTGTNAVPLATDARAALSVPLGGAAYPDPARSIVGLPAEASAASPFAARLLRQLEHRDGTSTLWLRDFRLGDARAASLVPLLRDAAAQSHVAIGRIVVNGRTLWHATPRDGDGRHAD